MSPKMGYTSKDRPFPRGEICVRGPIVFKGYVNLPEKTAEALDKAGWLHTGDIGLISGPGTVKIIDRVKNIFKLQQGEYIAPEKIENVYVRAPFVQQIFLHGDSLQSACLAVIFPDLDLLMPWAKAQGLPSGLIELCQNDKVKAEVMRQLSELNKSAQLKGFEEARGIYLSPEPFTVENNLMTPTFKLKRDQLKKRFATKIAELYRTL